MAFAKSYGNRSKTPRRDIYADVTDRIVAALEKGVAPWVRPWRSVGAFRNGTTDRPYHGVNTLLLAIETLEHAYDDPRWVTYKQARKLGGHVRKGERGTRIVFWKFLDRMQEDPETGKETLRRIPMARAYTVFNVEQCDGLELPELDRETLPETDRRDDLDELLRGTGAEIRHGGDVACYAPGPDKIALPAFGAFETPSAYYSTALHELTHWTGHGSRLDRSLRNRFGSQAYAAEELVAELGSAFLCERHGVDGKLQHPEYVANWLQVLKGDKRAIFTASSKARQAAEFLTGLADPEPAVEAEAVAA
ncbi:MAG: ArdC family protein [Planctomycetota bacterium]|jgi:antirestriction protein ArdC